MTSSSQVKPQTRVLIIKLSSLGDLFHSLPAVHNLKTSLGAVVDWVANIEYVALVKCFTDVDRIIPFPRHNLAQLPKFLRELRLQSYDLIIDLQGLLKSALVCRCARGKKRIGPSYQREGAYLFYDEVAGAANRQRHAVEQNLDLIRHLKLPLDPPVFPLNFPKVKLEGSQPRVALVPNSRWFSKNWPLEYFAATAQKLSELFQASFFIMGSQSDQENCAKLAQAIQGPVFNLAGKLTLPQLGSYLADMQLVITNDSGPMHIAAALETPLVALFGPTDPGRTGPYGKKNIVLTSNQACRPCYQRTCPLKTHLCLQACMPEQAVEAAVKLLAEQR